LPGDLWVEGAKLLGTFIGGGVVGSDVTSWVNWGIEKRRLKQQHRTQLIQDWRQLIASLPVKGGWSHGDPDCLAMFRSPHFISLEHHLPRDLLGQLRALRTIVVGGDFPRRQLSEQVAKLERKWGLV
jgi:hypothetical protein